MTTVNHIVLKHAVSQSPVFSDTEAWSCGTCEGLWIVEPDRILVSAIRNNCPHNGHFETFMKRIEKRAEKNNRDLYFISFFNQRFKEHLKKRGYEEITVTVRKDGEVTDGVVKRFRGVK